MLIEVSLVVATKFRTARFSGARKHILQMLTLVFWDIWWHLIIIVNERVSGGMQQIVEQSTYIVRSHNEKRKEHNNEANTSTAWHNGNARVSWNPDDMTLWSKILSSNEVPTIHSRTSQQRARIKRYSVDK